MYARGPMRAIHLTALSALWITACGGASTPAEEPEATAQETEATSDEPAPAAVPDGPVRWTLLEPLSIAPDGLVTIAGDVRGTLTEGAIVGTGGAAVASVDEQGVISVEGERTTMRIAGLEVFEEAGGAASRIMRIEGGELVTGDPGHEERLPIENYSAARGQGVLLVSVVLIVAMAAGMQH